MVPFLSAITIVSKPIDPVHIVLSGCCTVVALGLYLWVANAFIVHFFAGQ